MAGYERGDTSSWQESTLEYNRCIRRWTASHRGCSECHSAIPFNGESYSRAVGWIDPVNTNWVYSVLPLVRRPHCSPICLCPSAHPDLSKKPFLPIACPPRLIPHNSQGRFQSAAVMPILTHRKINRGSRAPAEVSMDGQEARILQPGEFISVEASPYPVPCIKRSADLFTSPRDIEKEKTVMGEKGGGDEWVRDINSLLQFNATFKNKHLAAERL
jgi:hypothetical protein